MAHPLKEYRDKENLSQEELADKLGVSRQMIGLIENGERHVPANALPEWEKKTGIPRAKLRPDIFTRAAA